MVHKSKQCREEGEAWFRLELSTMLQGQHFSCHKSQATVRSARYLCEDT